MAVGANEPIYKVIVNEEEQYSIWPTGREVPFGWTSEGTEGAKQLCLDRIQEMWTDLRPKSLRDALATAHYL